MSSYFDRAITSLPPIAEDIHARENAEIVRGWLAALQGGTQTEAQFDAQILGYHVFQYTAIYGPKDAYYAELVKQIDRRMHLRGLRYCHWRGFVPMGQYDDWRRDRARERAALPNKGDRAA